MDQSTDQMNEPMSGPTDQNERMTLCLRRRVTAEFNEINGLELICRAHQLVQEGLKYMFPEKSLVTVGVVYKLSSVDPWLERRRGFKYTR